jgi:AcrR family transcriptional regulator
MSEQKRKRPYRSPVREAAAAETRQRIVRAASELFLRQGFARTTTRSIATQAGVTERTLFLSFPSKAALLSACIRAAIRDGAETVPMLERDEWRRALAGDPDRIFQLLAEATTHLFERAAGLLAVGEAAAADDPLLQEQQRQGHEATRSDLLQVARAMKRAGALGPGISTRHAADALFALAGSETLYLRLVDECGWSPARYTGMLERALRGAVGKPAPAPPASRAAPWPEPAD